MVRTIIHSISILTVPIGLSVTRVSYYGVLRLPRTHRPVGITRVGRDDKYDIMYGEKGDGDACAYVSSPLLLYKSSLALIIWNPCDVLANV